MIVQLAVLLSGRRIGTLLQTHQVEFRYSDDYSEAEPFDTTVAGDATANGTVPP